MKTCPACGLKNLNSAVTCDCGSLIGDGLPVIESAPVLQAEKHGRRWPWIVIGISLSTLSIIMIQLPFSDYLGGPQLIGRTIAAAIAGVIGALMCMAVAAFKRRFSGGVLFVLILILITVGFILASL